MKFSQDDIDNFINHAGYDDGMRFVQSFLKQHGTDILGLANKNGETAFIRAASFGKPEMMTVLAEAGAQVPVTHADQPFIIWLAGNGHPAGLRWLLGHGGDTEVTGKENTTALMVASLRRGFGPNVKELLDGGAKPNARDARGRGAVSHAAMLGDEMSIRALAAAGADLRAKDNEGKTALHYAVQFKNEANVKALMELGADLDAEDRDGVSCAALAKKYSLSAIFEVERKRRAEDLALIMQGSPAKIAVKPPLKLKPTK